MGKILVQDNDADNRAVISLVLQEGNQEVLSVESYDEAVYAVEVFKPDLVYLDFLVYDSQRSSKACAQIKSRHPGLPVVALSCDSQIAMKFFKNGFDNFLEKPFSIESLLSLTKQYLVLETVSKVTRRVD